MELIRAVAIELAKDKDFNGKWPEAIDGHEQAKEFTQVSSYEIEFDVPIQTYTSGDRTYSYETYEVVGLKYMEEYERGETITREEYEAYVAEHPNLIEEITKLTPVNIAKIAALNTQISAMVDEINVLADEIGIDAVIDLGSNGVLSLNSDWDSSRC